MLNAPLIAIKKFDAANWHLPLRELYAGIGGAGVIASGFYSLYHAAWDRRQCEPATIADSEHR